MKRSLFGRLFSIFLLFGAGCRTIDARLESAASPKDCLQATADFYVKDAGDDACAVVLVTSEGASFATAGACTTNSLFRIASLSKLFLVSALQNAAADGAVDLDATVGTFSSLGFPAEYASITLRELMENRAGLPRDFIDESNPIDVGHVFAGGFFGWHIYAQFDSAADFLRCCHRPCWRRFVRKTRAITPRPVIYSNVGYGLLGLCLEEQTGLSLEQFLKENLVQPLGLKETTYEPERAGLSSRTTPAKAGHLPWFVRRGHAVPDIRLGPPLRAAGGLFSSIADCARVFADYWRIVDAECAGVPVENLPDNALIGLLRVKELATGAHVLYRAGMIYGGASFVCFDPETRNIVIILRNVTSWPDKRGFKLVEALQRRQRGNRPEEHVEPRADRH
mgnify:FL=1